MNSFDNTQCDELAYEPTAADWAEYQEWLAQLPDEEPLFFPDDFEDDITPSELLSFEECEDPIDLYGGDDSHFSQYDEGE